MKANLTPLYFKTPHDPDFVKQLDTLRSLFDQQAEILEPLALGAPMPKEADAVVFPQMLGEGYKRLVDFKAIELPILVITSEFGTVSMWDWEINTYLASEGVRVLAPNSLEQARKFIKACGLKRELKSTRVCMQTHLKPQKDHGDSQHGCVTTGQLVVARRHSARLLQAVDQPLHLIALPI